MTGYQYCAGCNTNYVDTGCGQDREHAGCPHPCGNCGKPINGRDDGCQGHSIEEHRAFMAWLRARPVS